MDDVEQKKTASVLSVIAGMWLAFSPLWIPLNGAGAFWSLYIAAAVFVLFGAVQFFTENTTPSWIIGLTAVWLFLSAFTLSVSAAASWNQAVTAIIAFILAMWDGAEADHIHQRHAAGMT